MSHSWSKSRILTVVSSKHLKSYMKTDAESRGARDFAESRQMSLMKSILMIKFRSRIRKHKQLRKVQRIAKNLTSWIQMIREMKTVRWHPSFKLMCWLISKQQGLPMIETNWRHPRGLSLIFTIIDGQTRLRRMMDMVGFTWARSTSRILSLSRHSLNQNKRRMSQLPHSRTSAPPLN